MQMASAEATILAMVDKRALADAVRRVAQENAGQAGRWVMDVACDARTAFWLAKRLTEARISVDVEASSTERAILRFDRELVVAIIRLALAVGCTPLPVSRESERPAW